MVLVKKLIALALVAAFLISAGVGCTGSPTTKPATSTDKSTKP
jgi:hypothetical protein